MVSEWCQHRDETVVPIGQGENAELVEDGLPVGSGRKQPVEVLLADPLREEGNDSEKLPGVRAELLEHWGGERQLDRDRQALVVLRLEYVRLAPLPLLQQSTIVPPVLTRDRG